MRNFISVLIASVFILSTAQTARADNSENVVIGILGGALGGLIIGGAIANNHHHRNNNVYIYQQPVPQPECWKRWVTIWDPYIQQYVQVKRVYCQ